MSGGGDTQAAAEEAAAPAPPPGRALTRQQKAAIIIGVLGPEEAGPLLEQLDEQALRGFAEAMAELTRVGPDAVEATIREFLAELETAGAAIHGGLETARAVLERHLDEKSVNRILDQADSPTLQNVWRKLARVNEEALAEFLTREHPQTTAVILSKLPSDFAARVLDRIDPARARDIVMGITRAQSLDNKVVEAIGASVSRDFLSAHGADRVARDPAERVGAIMNFTSPALRNRVIDEIAEGQPDFAEEIKRKMFTFEDIPARIGSRDAPAVVRSVEPDLLLRALAGAEGAASEAAEFLLSNISSRVAAQIRSDIEEMGEITRKDAEAAQNEVILAIRKLAERGEVSLRSGEEEDR